VLEHVDDTVFTINDDQIRETMHFTASRLKLDIEPAAATGLAAALDGQIAAAFNNNNGNSDTENVPKQVAVVLCGGNVDPTVLASVLR